MPKFLLFLESETKRRTIQFLLKNDYLVLATGGHLCNLKKQGKYNLGIDLKNFTPSYEVLFEKKKFIQRSKKILRENYFQQIYLATDPDREGEGIANELIRELNLEKNKCLRILFHEITATAILNSLKNPFSINQNLVESQMSRQVLDKMIGFCISPLLYKQTKALSAGRVQSVVLKMIIEKEKEILAYEQTVKKKYIIKGIEKEKKYYIKKN